MLAMRTFFLAFTFFGIGAAEQSSCNKHLKHPRQPLSSSVHFQCEETEDGKCKPSLPDSFSKDVLRDLVRNVSAFVPSSRNSKVDASTIQNKVLAGYQGWTTGPDNNWRHWSNNHGTPSSSNAHFEMVPQVGEYPSGSLHSTNLRYNRNGSTIKLFASDDKGVVDLHFKWMADYGLDGVLLQRFVHEIDSSGSAKNQRDKVTEQMDAAATNHGRTWAMMYDLSSAHKADDVIKSDWKHFVAKFTSNPQYLREQGKPVVCIFGIGLTTRAKVISPSASLSLIKWLQAEGLYVIGSGPYSWRTENHDAAKGYLHVHAAFDAIMPWSVGRYHTVSDFKNKHSTIDGDAALTRSRNQHYAPIAYAGYSYRDGHNFNSIPRNAGQFFKAQIDKFLSTKGATFYYIAMFDEVQEGTAIYKMAANEDESAAPKGCFVTMSIDGTSCPGDLYLKMAGQWAAAAKGHPIPPPSPGPRPSPRPTPAPPSPTPVGGDTLSRGETLSAGEELHSTNGKVKLSMQGSDGNLVLYENGSPVWTASTGGYPGARLTFQGSDGNLVVYDVNGQARWSTGHHSDARTAMVTNDCNFVVVDGSSSVVWSTGTSCSGVLVV